jgi:hypothetical protein
MASYEAVGAVYYEHQIYISHVIEMIIAHECIFTLNSGIAYKCCVPNATLKSLVS